MPPHSAYKRFFFCAQEWSKLWLIVRQGILEAIRYVSMLTPRAYFHHSTKTIWLRSPTHWQHITREMQEVLVWKQKKAWEVHLPSELTPAESLLNVFNAASYDYLTYTCKPLLCICIFSFVLYDVKCYFSLKIICRRF